MYVSFYSCFSLGLGVQSVKIWSKELFSRLWFSSTYSLHPSSLILSLSLSISLSYTHILTHTHTHTRSLLRSCTLKSLQLTLTRVWASCLVYLTALVRFPGENELTAPEKSTTISIWISLRRILEKAREDFKTEKYVERKKDISIWNKHIGKR